MTYIATETGRILVILLAETVGANLVRMIAVEPLWETIAEIQKTLPSGQHLYRSKLNLLIDLHKLGSSGLIRFASRDSQKFFLTERILAEKAAELSTGWQDAPGKLRVALGF